MDDYAEYLAQEAKSEIVALHQFKILYNELDSVHFFFEGEEDSLFYMPESRRLLRHRAAHVYDCGGKKSVIDVRDSIKNEGYDINSCLFFVDRDYDDYLGTQVIIDDRTYITDFYSIESNVSSIMSAKIFMEDIMGLSCADPMHSDIVNILTSAYSEFYRLVRPLMAWILAAKESGLGPNLNNTKGLKGVLIIKNGMVRRNRAGFQSFRKKLIGHESGQSFNNILKWHRKLEFPSCKNWVRGKYDIWFFQTALLSIIDYCNSIRRGAGARAIRVPSSLRDGHIFEVLGGRLPAPDSLLKFLGERLN